MECPNCDHPLDGNYCAKCGRPAQLPRIDGRFIIDEIGSVLSFKKGILFTIRELLIRPGQNIRSFILEDRHRLVKPAIFVIFCSFIYTILQRLLEFEDGYIRYNGEKLPESAVVAIFQWAQANYGYANIIIALFVAVWIKILFRKRGYNFFEILILLLFVFGMVMLIMSFFGAMEVFTGLNLMEYGAMITFIYTSWAIGQFFDGRKIINYLKAFFAYVLGMVLAVVTALMIGKFIDLMS